MSAGKNTVKILLLTTGILATILSPCRSLAADVIIIGNTNLKPVSDIVSIINDTLDRETSVTPVEEIENNLGDIVRRENARAVVALGTDALNISLSLPESIPVIYGLLILPPETERKNITGVYMTTPVGAYVSFIRTYFPEIKKLGVVCANETTIFFDGHKTPPELMVCNASTPYEFLEGLSSLIGKVDALLLMPEKNLITSKVLKEVYLFSFKEKVPVIGISEKYVKTGSLFSLGFDTADMGRQIGEMVRDVIRQGSARNIAERPPEKLDLYINKKTSEAMKVEVPSELKSMAVKVYP